MVQDLSQLEAEPAPDVCAYMGWLTSHPRGSSWIPCDLSRLIQLHSNGKLLVDRLRTDRLATGHTIRQVLTL